MTRLKSRIDRLEKATRSLRQEPRPVFLVTEDGLAAAEEELRRLIVSRWTNSATLAPYLSIFATFQQSAEL